MTLLAPPVIASPLATPTVSGDRQALIALTDEKAERAVLGAILFHPDAIGIVSAILTLDDFTRKWHRDIYRTALEMHEAGIVVEQIGLLDALARNGIVSTPSDDADVLGLVLEVPNAYHVEHYARVVEELATRRRLLRVGQLIEGFAETAKDAGEAITQANDALGRLSRRKGETQCEGIRELVAAYFEELDRTSGGQGPLVGVPTGILDLDKTIGGLQKGDLTLLAARPSVGKTSLALAMMLHAARRGVPVGIVSLEMSKPQLIHRMVSMASNVDGTLLRSGRYGEEEVGRVTNAIGVLAELPVHIDDASLVTIPELRQRAVMFQKKYNVEVVMIDYLQLVRGTNSRDGRVQEVSEISRQCKAMARDLNIAVLAVCQLNRLVEQRQGGQPQLSDLRDSGQLEQDADVVIFIHRDTEARMSDPQQTVHVTVAKHRNGPLTQFPMWFLPGTTTFQPQSRRNA